MLLLSVLYWVICLLATLIALMLCFIAFMVILCVAYAIALSRRCLRGRPHLNMAILEILRMTMMFLTPKPILRERNASVQ